jgi:hypothetical protein
MNFAYECIINRQIIEIVILLTWVWYVEHLNLVWDHTISSITESSIIHFGTLNTILTFLVSIAGLVKKKVVMSNPYSKIDPIKPGY